MQGLAGASVRYGSYLLAQTLPTPPLAHRWRRRHLLSYRLLAADPARIRRRLVGPEGWSPEEQRRYRRELVDRFERDWVVPGEWEEATEAFDPRSAVVQALAERSVVADPETIRWLADAVMAGDTAAVHRAALPTDAEAHLVHVVDLARSIRLHGVRSQRARGGHPTRGEITVYISRSGAPVLGLGGNHRVTIARYLGVEAVPVLVGGAHPDWAAGCTRRHGAGVRALYRGLAEALRGPDGR